MRADMYKVIVDRPRSLSRSFSKLRNEYRAAKKFKLDVDGDVCDEFSRRILPIRSRRVGYDYKEFNDLLSPLQRYLKKQVGRPWADVWSEICSVNSADSKMQWHLRCHVLGAVYLNCCYASDGMGAVQVMGAGRHFPIGRGALYVDPETSNLCEVGA